VDLGAGWNEIQDNSLCVSGIGSTDDTDPVPLESGSGSRDAYIVRDDRELTAERSLEVGLALSIHGVLSTDFAI